MVHCLWFLEAVILNKPGAEILVYVTAIVSGWFFSSECVPVTDENEALFSACQSDIESAWSNVRE